MEIDTTRRAVVWIACATAAMTVITFGVALATPPISGSFCRESCIDYPYLDTLERFPRDYLWMPLAIVLTVLYVALVASVHELTPPSRRLASRIALALAVVTTTVLVTEYFVQFTVVPASLAHGQTDGIALLTQYNPHGLFIALEEVGYLAMALSFGAVAVAVPDRRRAARAVRWVFGATPVAVFAGLVWIMITRGTDRGYLFEIIVITIDWFALLVGAVLLARLFRSPPEVSGSSRTG
jgi:hypothetical protein